MKDQWTAVDERFDKEFTCVVTYEKWPDEEEQRLREPQYKFKDFPNTNPKIIKNFLHSELEKVRQETIKNCMAMLPDKEPEDHTSNRFPAEECRAFNMAIKQAKKNIQALSINKKQQ